MAEKEYIEKNHLINTIINSTALYDATVLRLIKIEPTADVQEVIRCKDCSYFCKATVNKKGFLICPASGMEITDNDFCSYGERKCGDSNE